MVHNLKESLSRLPPDIYERILFIGRVADDMGYPACVIGGLVRDLLLGVDNFDLDIVVEGDGINFAKELAQRAGGDLVKHRRFGTATVIIPPKPFPADKGPLGLNAGDCLKIDIATARKEVYESPASLPKVTPGTLKDDLSRRDFSVNAMGFSIRRENFGELIDFFNGRRDLKDKKIRALHDLSFIDDPTRVLRAIRFEQRYDFKIEAHTLRLIREAVKLKMLHKVQKHRLRDDIILLLKEKRPLKCIRRLENICGFDFIHPDIRLDGRRISSLRKVGRAFNWFLNSFPSKRKIELWLAYFMILLGGLSYRQLHKVAHEFALRRGQTKRILSFESDADDIIVKLKHPLPPSRIYRILEHITYEVMLLIVLKANSRRVSKNIENFLRHYNEVRVLAGGEDLKRLGILPGPRYKEILKKILYAKLDNQLQTKEEELLYLKREIIK